MLSALCVLLNDLIGLTSQPLPEMMRTLILQMRKGATEVWSDLGLSVAQEWQGWNLKPDAPSPSCAPLQPLLGASCLSWPHSHVCCSSILLPVSGSLPSLRQTPCSKPQTASFILAFKAFHSVTLTALVSPSSAALSPSAFPQSVCSSQPCS